LRLELSIGCKGNFEQKQVLFGLFDYGSDAQGHGDFGKYSGFDFDGLFALWRAEQYAILCKTQSGGRIIISKLWMIAS
jgi:hypothetical protein